jgi:hypothetical protein
MATDGKASSEILPGLPKQPRQEEDQEQGTIGVHFDNT